jgi:signal transduction histidine kinase
MENFINKIINTIKTFFEKKEDVVLTIFILLAILSLVSLFMNSREQFNTLKTLVFINLVISLLGLGLSLKFKHQAKKEKFDFFFAFIQNILDNLQEGIVLYNDEFKIIFANQSFSKIVKLKKDELTNFVVKSDMVKNENYQILANIFFPFLQGEDLKIVTQNPETIEVKFLHPEEKYFLISYVDVYLDKKYKLRVVLDKTQDVIESQRRLEFIQMISHNLLTPLSEIRWNLESLNLEEISKENKDFIEIALRIIKSTIVLAESTLSLLRTEFGKLEIKIEEVDLEKIIVSVLDVLKEKIEEKKIKVNVEIEETVTKVNLDKSIISLSLFALIENAILYNKLGGTVEIKIQKMLQRPYLEITIADTGIGMTQKDLINLFKKYYRGEKARESYFKGFGIGLYNTKNLINLHGGEIKVESEENKGTKVTIVLPLDPNLIPGYKVTK